MLSDVMARRRLRASASQIISACKTARSKRIEFEEVVISINAQVGSGAAVAAADEWDDFGLDADEELEMVRNLSCCDGYHRYYHHRHHTLQLPPTLNANKQTCTTRSLLSQAMWLSQELHSAQNGGGVLGGLRASAEFQALQQQLQLSSQLHLDRAERDLVGAGLVAESTRPSSDEEARGPSVRRVVSPRVRAIRHYRSANGLPVEAAAAAAPASPSSPEHAEQGSNAHTPSSTQRAPSSSHSSSHSSSRSRAARDILDMQAQEQIALNRAILLSLDSTNSPTGGAAESADDESLLLLESMGFTRDAAGEALRSTNNHVDSAINTLLSAGR